MYRAREILHLPTWQGKVMMLVLVKAAMADRKVNYTSFFFYSVFIFILFALLAGSGSRLFFTGGLDCVLLSLGCWFLCSSLNFFTMKRLSVRCEHFPCM